MTETLIEASRRIVAELTNDGAPFEMIEKDVEGGGKKTRVFARAPESVIDLYQFAEDAYADRSLAIEGDRIATFKEVFSAARRLAAVLQDRYGIRPGDRVGISSRNRPEWVVSFLAITHIGAVAVLFNSRAPAEEFSVMAEDKGCKAIIADTRRAAIVRKAGIVAPIITITDEGDEKDDADFAALVASADREAEPVRVGPEEPAAILFTSGTTGRPKGATLSQRNLCHLSLSNQFMTAHGQALAAHVYGIPLETLVQMSPRVSSLLIFPMFHVSGLVCIFMSLHSGGLMVTMPRWNPSEALDLIERHKVTFLSGPALVLSDLLDQPDAERRMEGVASVGVGGQSTPANLTAKLAAMLPRAQQGAGWGMTELAGSVSAANGPLYMTKSGSCGVVSPVVDVCALDASGRELPRGQTGELAARGPVVMKGYWNDPQATAASYRNGWFLTGDIGYVDEDDFVFLVDRKKDMVISAGENIYCAEVEQILSRHRHVREVALFGVPDERLGERAVAAVTLAEGADCLAEELRGMVREHLADYKVPTEFRFDLGPLPRNTLGKTDKPALRDRYLAFDGGAA